MKKIRFIFDLDGTITSFEPLNTLLNKFNLQEEFNRLVDDSIEGNTPFMENFIDRVNLISKIPISEISDLLYKLPLNKDIVKFIQNNKNNCSIATGNLSCWVNRLVSKIGCECLSSETEEKDNQVVKIKTILRKETVVKKYKALGYTTVFVGDGNNDVEAMRLADISIASGIFHEPANSVHSVVNYTIYEEGALCRLLNQLL